MIFVFNSRTSRILMRGRDSNPRPVGYEPTELPLLYLTLCDAALHQTLLLTLQHHILHHQDNRTAYELALAEDLRPFLLYGHSPLPEGRCRIALGSLNWFQNIFGNKIENCIYFIQARLVTWI